MDEISNLIKEAKPLYFERKRNKRNAKILFCTLFVMLFASSFTFFDVNNKSESIVAEYNVSNIAEMGLPVDDFGLLTVE